MLTLEQIRERLKEIDDEPEFIHLKSDRGHHNWYKNIPLGRIMLETDFKTISSIYSDVSFRIESSG